jgi:hypothetical protein
MHITALQCCAAVREGSTDHAREGPVGLQQVLQVDRVTLESGPVLHQPREELQEDRHHVLDDLELDCVKGRAGREENEIKISSR